MWIKEDIHSSVCVSVCVQKHFHSNTGYITSTEQASDTKDGLDKSNCHVTRKQKTVLPFQVSSIKHKPKQKHTAKLAAFMLKSNRNSISLWWGSLKGTPSCQALSGLWAESSQTNTIHIEWLRSAELWSHAARWSPMRAKASPRGYIIIFLKVLSLRWKGEQHVISLRLMSRNALNQKQCRPPSSHGHSSAVLCPTNKLDWRELMCHPASVSY